MHANLKHLKKTIIRRERVKRVKLNVILVFIGHRFWSERKETRFSVSLFSIGRNFPFGKIITAASKFVQMLQNQKNDLLHAARALIWLGLFFSTLHCCALSFVSFFFFVFPIFLIFRSFFHRMHSDELKLCALRNVNLVLNYSIHIQITPWNISSSIVHCSKEWWWWCLFFAHLFYRSM